VFRINLDDLSGRVVRVSLAGGTLSLAEVQASVRETELRRRSTGANQTEHSRHHEDTKGEDLD